MKLHARLTFSLLLLLFASRLHAQYGTETAQAGNLFDDDQNQVRTTFYNTGLVGNVGVVSFEWPRGSGDEYIGDLTPYLAVEYAHPSGHTIHSAITCLSPRQSPEYGNTGLFNGFMPLPGFYSGAIGPVAGLPRVAMSNDPSSWPTSWPGLGGEWSGQWVGIDGPHNFIAGVEAYWQMDDNQDREFRTLQSPGGDWYNLYPSPSDTSRGGVGLRMEMRGLQFLGPLVENSLVFMYILHNDGIVQIPEARFGEVVGTMAGGRGDTEDDEVQLLSGAPIVINMDADDQGAAGWTPLNDSTNVGVTGFAFLQTPEDLGMNSLDIFAPPGNLRMNDDEALWDRIEPGHWESGWGPDDCDFVTGTGGFILNPGEADTIYAAVMFAPDTLQMIATYNYLRSYLHSGWDVFGGNLGISSPTFGDVVSGVQTITYTNAPGAATADLYICRSYQPDGPWERIVLGTPASGSYEWDTTPYHDSARVWSCLVNYDEEGEVIGIGSNGWFTINNDVPAPPELYILSPAMQDTLLTEQANLQWWAGDADGDDVLIDIDYLPGDGERYSVAQAIPNSSSFTWDTRIFPNSNQARLEFAAVSNGDRVVQTSVPFRKQYDEGWLDENSVQHTAGTAEINPRVRICVPDEMQSDLYVISFDWDHHYSVFDESTDQWRIQNQPVTGVEGELLDGLRLTFDPRPTALDLPASGWIDQQDRLDARLLLANYVVGRVPSLPLPCDFDIAFSDHTVDTGDSLVGFTGLIVPSVPVNFTVWNRTLERRQSFVFDTRNGDWPASYNNCTIVLLDTIDGEPTVSWCAQLERNEQAGQIEEPSWGDTLRIRAFKGYSGWDRYSILLGEDSAAEPIPALPTTATLGAAYPNPFNDRCLIRYTLPASQRLELSVFNLLGQRVASLVEGVQAAGEHKVAWRATGLASGLYFVRLETANVTRTRKIMLLK